MAVTLNNNNSNNNLIVGSDGVPLQFIPPVPPPQNMPNANPTTSINLSGNSNDDKSTLSTDLPDPKPAVMNSVSEDPSKTENTNTTPSDRSQSDSKVPKVEAVTLSQDPSPNRGQNGSGLPEDLDLRWHSWKCLVCGYFYEGHSKKTECPRCGNSDPDKFD